VAGISDHRRLAGRVEASRQGGSTVHKELLKTRKMPTPSSRPVSGKKEQKSKSKTKEPVKEAKADLLDQVSAPRTFERPGVEAVLDCYMGTNLSEADASFCVELLGSTMKMLHSSTGGARGAWDTTTQADFVKRLRDQKSRVFMIRSTEARKTEGQEEEDEWVLVEDNGEDDALVAVHQSERKNLGFLHVQLSLDKSPPSLVVLEMQVVPDMRGKGLGKHVMEVMQMIATKMGLTLVLYNIFKANARALQQITRGDGAAPENMPMAPQPMVKAH